jgi:hypothetical protein
MPFCPQCRFEYKPGVWECPDCGVRLVDKLPEESPKNPQKEPASEVGFVPLRNLPSRLYAEMLQGALENNGIACMLKGDEGVAFRTTTRNIPISRITVWVPGKDLKRAREIADQMLDHI